MLGDLIQALFHQLPWKLQLGCFAVLVAGGACAVLLYLYFDAMLT